MNRYYCDVCGDEIPTGYKTPDAMNGNGIEALCHVDDVCEHCGQRGENMDIAQALLEAWRKRVFPQQMEDCKCND